MTDALVLISVMKASLGQPLITVLPSSTKNMTRMSSQVMDPLEMVVYLKAVILFEGDFVEFFPAVCNDNQGCMLCPASRLKNSAEGFSEKVKKDSFLVRAEIRLKLQDNERWTVSVERKTATCTVRSTFPLKHNDV